MPHQSADMNSGTGGQRVKVVPTLHNRNNLPPAMAFRQRHKLIRDPGVILGFQPEVRHRVGNMGVEAGRDDQ